MEFLTHALLGAVMGECVLGKRLGNRALGWGALAGLLPYWDAVAIPFLDTADRMVWHQGPSHSILWAMLVAWLLSKPMAKRWKREKITRVRAGGVILGAWILHIAVDCLGTSGVAAFWPLPFDRVALGILPPGDPLFLLPALAGIPWLAACRDKKSQPKRRKRLILTIGITALYLLAAGGLKFKVARDVEAIAQPRGTDAKHRLILPTRHQPLVWRVLVDHGEEIHVARRAAFGFRSTPVQWTVFPRGIATHSADFLEREPRRIDRATGGFWIARRHKRGLWIGDLRHGEVRETGNREGYIDLHLRRAWNYEPDAAKDRLIPAHATPHGLRHDLRDLAAQLTGNAGATAHTPRLAGVTGQFPEPLVVRE